MSSSTIALSPSARLDAWLGGAPFCDVLALRTAASADAVMRAARALTPRDVPLGTSAAAMHDLPRTLTGHGADAIDVDRPLVEAILERGGVILEERPSELILGIAGALYRVRGRQAVALRSPDELAAFDRAGCEKVGISVRAVAMADGGCVVALEHRTIPSGMADGRERRRLERYWRVLGPAAAVIARQVLRAIARRAERAEGLEMESHEEHIATSVRF